MAKTRSLLIVHSGYPEDLNFYMPDNGLANLAACLLAAGHETEIIDYSVPSVVARHERPDRRRDLARLVHEGDPGALRAIRNEDEAHDARIFAELGEELAERVEREHIDWVGFKLWGGDGSGASVAMAEAVRRRVPSTKIIVGGPQADRMRHHLLLASEAIDCVCIKEGEPTIVSFAEHVAGQRPIETVPNLLLRDGGGFRRTRTVRVRDLGSLPFPCYDPAVYPAIDEKMHIFNYEEARGCRNRCTFCSQVDKSGYLRVKSAQQVFDELLRLRDHHRMRAFRMCSSFTPAELTDDLSRLIVEGELGVPWNTFGHVHDADRVDYALMKDAGCISIFFGVETGSQRILDEVLWKDLKVEDTRRALSDASAAGLDVIASVIYPNPTEDEASREDTLSLLRAVRPYAVTAYPPGLFPGSRWWSEPETFGFAVSRDEYWASLLHFKMQLSFPIELWQNLDYRVDGKPMRQLYAECGAFLDEVSGIPGVRSRISDPIVLFSRVLGEEPESLRDRTARAVIERDVEAIGTVIANINGGKLPPTWGQVR